MNNEFCYETKLCLSMFNPYLPAKVLKLSSKVNIKLSTVKFKRLGWLSSLLVHTTFYHKFVFILGSYTIFNMRIYFRYLICA